MHVRGQELNKLLKMKKITTKISFLVTKIFILLVMAQREQKKEKTKKKNILNNRDKFINKKNKNTDLPQSFLHTNFKVLELSANIIITL